MEFEERGIPYISEAQLEVSYKKRTLAKYYESDFICFNKIIVEIKALSELSQVHESQVINYLKATGFKLGILINFGAESLEYRRLIRH
jgi:GxxExxY protein